MEKFALLMEVKPELPDVGMGRESTEERTEGAEVDGGVVPGKEEGLPEVEEEEEEVE